VCIWTVPFHLYTWSFWLSIDEHQVHFVPKY